MAAPKNNQYWRLVKNWKNGADVKYEPEALFDKAIEYFDWVEENPLYEEKVTSGGKKVLVKKHRAMTIKAFCLFANIGLTTFENYSKNQAYMYVTARIRDIIYTQKFEGASADLFNTNIIARELGLVDKKEVDAIISDKEVRINKWLKNNSE